MTELSADNPFKVGAYVVKIRSAGWGDRQTSNRYKIAKVYKNGNFVLEGDKQQWRPSGRHYTNEKISTAYATGDHYGMSRPHCESYVPEIHDAQRKEEVAKINRLHRLEKINQWMRLKRDMTEGQLDLIEQAMSMDPKEDDK